MKLRMKKFSILKIIAVFSVLGNSSYAQQWTSYNPTAWFDINTIDIPDDGAIAIGGGQESNDSIQIMFRGDNYGLSWTENAHDGPNPWNRSIAFSDSLHGFGVGYDGRIIYSDDGGYNWGYAVYPIDRNLNKIVNVDPTTWFVAGGNEANDSIQTILRSSDNGVSWDVIHDAPGSWLKSIHFTDALKGYAVGDNGVILGTSNGGDSWSTITSPVIRDFNTITFLNADTGYIVGGDQSGIRTILRTVNGGADWTVLIDEAGGELNDISFADSVVAYIVGDSATVLKTSDAGLTWNAIVIDTSLTGTETFNAVKFHDPYFGVIGGKAGKLYVHVDAPLPEVITIGYELIDSSHAELQAIINTHDIPAYYSFCYSTDSLFSTYSCTNIQDVTSSSFVLASANASGLIPDTTYYYFAKAQNMAGVTFGDTLNFFTGDPSYVFKTDATAEITATTALLLGVINKFPEQVNLFFQYDTSLVFANEAVAVPATVNDTLLHWINSPLTGLQTGVTYYYRLKGVTASGIYYGSIKNFYTGIPYTAFETLPAIVTSDSTVQLKGLLEGFQFPVTASFEYGTTLEMTHQTWGTQYNDSAFYFVWNMADGLLPNTLYYFRMKGVSSVGAFFGNTLTFYTGSNNRGFQTLLATGITPTSANLNGQADELSFPTNLSFEYGTTRALGNEITATPEYVNDTLRHPVSAELSGLTPNTLYFFRLKGNVATGMNFYGDIKQLYAADCEIPNCDFEEWDSTLVEAPTLWSIVGESHKVASYNGTYAAEFRGADLSHLGAILGPFVHKGLGGGYPFAARPDSIRFYARYDIVVGDTAYVASVFNLNGIAINQQFFPITGSSGGNFVLKKFKITFPTGEIPDSLALFCMSSNGLTEDPTLSTNPNSILAIDNITFPGTSLTVTNSNFELWDNFAVDHPQSWNTRNESLSSDYDPLQKTTDRVSGSYAAILHNDISKSHKYASLNSGNCCGYSHPTIAVGAKHNTFNGFVKFIPDGGDTLWISVNMYKNGVPIGAGLWKNDTAITEYFPFSVDINYSTPGSTEIPDSADISISLGISDARGNSFAYIDNISFDGFHYNGENENRLPDNSFTIFPNPANNSITAELEGFTGKMEFSLYNISGEKLYDFNENNEKYGRVTRNINTSSFPSGIYLLNVQTEKVNMTRKFVIQK